MTTPENPRSPFPSRRSLHAHDPRDAGVEPVRSSAWDEAAATEREQAFLAQARHAGPRSGTDSERDRAATREESASTAAPAPQWRPTAVRKDVQTPSEPAPADAQTAAATEAEGTPGAAPHPIFDAPVREAAARGAEFVEPPAETTGMRSRRLEHERKRVQRRRRAQRIRAFIIVLLILGLLGGAVWSAFHFLGNDSGQSEAVVDYPGPGEGSVEVTVDPGDAGTAIGQKLVDAGVVKSVEAFVAAFTANQAATSIRPGTYSLKLRMSAAGAVAALLDDANRSENTVTITPGQTVSQVTARIMEVTGADEKAMEAAISDRAAIGLPDEANGTLEGWLAPGAYEVGSADTPTTLLKQMVAARVAQLDALRVPAGQRETVLIKASILEREVNVDEYLPKVARVIENRLADTAGETRGMLQMDSTVLYGVGKTGGIPTAEDLKKDTPYNTYIHPGLPPTPISHPDEAAIKAVLNPADGDWLYFVTVNLDTGETLFAVTHDEQVANSRKLDEYCAAHSDKC